MTLSKLQCSNLLALALLTISALSCSFPGDPSPGIIELAWTFPKDNLWNSGENIEPAIKDGKVYYVADTSLISRELESGDLVWKVSLGNSKPIDSKKLILSEKRLYVHHRDFLHSYDATTGELYWSNSDPEVGSVSNVAQMTETEQHLFIPGYDSVVKVKKMTGEIEQVINLESKESGRRAGRVGTMALSLENYLYIPGAFIVPGSGQETQGNIFCYDAVTGEYIWEYKVPNRKVILPGGQDSIFVSAGVQDCHIWGNYVVTMAGHSVTALNRFTGEFAWEQIWNDEGFHISGIGAENNRVFAGTAQGNIYGMDLQSGEILWSVPTHFSIINTFTLKANRLYFCNNVGSGLWIIDQNNGDVLWHDEKPKEGFYMSPIAVGDGFMVNVGSQAVYAFKVRQ